MGFTRGYIKDRRFVLTLVRDGANNKPLEKHVHFLTTETEGMHPFVEHADVSELHDASRLTELGTTI